MKLKVAAGVLALALAAVGPAKAQINVCLWGTITGPDALVNGMSYGVRDYLEFLNQTQGGIAGTKVNTLLLDGRYKLDEELKIYRRCVDEEQAVVINGWSTGSVQALREQINSDAVPFMTQSFASSVLDPQKYPYIFMAGPTYEQQMAIAFRDLANNGGKRVVIMAPDNEYGRGPVTVVRQSGIIKQLGLDLVDTVEFRYDAQDLTAQLLRVKSRNPDMVYIQASTPQAIAILRDAAKVGLPAKLFIGNLYTISPAIPEQLGEAAEGFRAIQAYEPFGADIPAMRQINQFSMNATVEKKDIYYMKGWMEGIAIAAAIENAVKKNGGHPPTDIKQFRQEVRAQLEALTNLDAGGITPTLNFANHQGSVQARIAQVKSGKYVPSGEWINAN